MDTFVQPPNPLSDSGDITQNWQKWRTDFLNFMKASNSMSKSKDLKAYLLRSHIGKVGQDVIEKIISNLEEKDDMNTLLQKLDKYFALPKTEVAERYIFFTSTRKWNVSIEEYITQLKVKATTCNFGNMTDSLIRDKIILELKDEQLRKKLFNVKDLDLLTLVLICNDHLSTVLKKKQSIPKNKSDTAVKDTSVEDVKQFHMVNTSNYKYTSNQSTNIQHKRNCKKCNQRHPLRACPAWSFKCEKCGGYNHYTHCCPHDFTKNTNTEVGSSNSINVNLQKNNQQDPTAPPLSDVDIALYSNLAQMKSSLPQVTLNGAEGTVPPGRVYKKVAIVENFFDIIHAVHVDLEGRPGKHAGQKRTYRTITETYAFLPREAVTRFLLGCTECQRRPRTPSPTNLSSQSQSTSTTPLTTTTLTSTTTPLSPAAGIALTTTSTTSVQSSPKPREGNHGGEGKPLYSYRHQRHQKGSTVSTVDKTDKEKEEKYNPLSITNLLKKEPVTGSFLPGTDSLPESRRTPESDRASSRSSASSKRKRMLPEGRTPSPQPSQPLPRPWSPGLDPKNTPIDYSLPITTSYLKHQQRLLQQAEKNKAAAMKETEIEQKVTVLPADEIDTVERERYSPATGLIDTNLNLLATIQHLHCQVMLALTERLRPSMTMPNPLVLPSATNMLSNGMMMGSEVSVQTGENHT